MKIAFISTRGVPNYYGGFEQFAEYISVGLVERGHDVTVYSPHYHPYKENSYKGVRVKHIYSPELWMGGSVGSFFYDFLSFKDALRKEHFDIIYVAGYTSIIPAYLWFNVKKIKSPVITTNMDGLENTRSKFNRLTRRFLGWEEKKAVEFSHYLVADNMGIYDYYKKRYGKESKFLAYGANISGSFDETVLSRYGLKQHSYFLLIARMEPENNIEMAIEGFLKSNPSEGKPLVIVGKMTTKYGKYLLERYGNNPCLIFPGGIYDFGTIDSIRHYSLAYFHGHSVGGTNPSLLEAMAAGCFILAHDNSFNRAVLKENAVFFKDENKVAESVKSIDDLRAAYSEQFFEGEKNEIQSNYSWEHLVDQYEEYFQWLIKQKK